MRKIAILLILLSQLTFAQNKQMSLEDAVYGRYTYLNPSFMYGLTWKNSEVFTHISNNSLVAKSVKNEHSDTLITLTDLNRISGAEFNYFPNYNWLSDEVLLVSSSRRFMIVNSIDKSIEYQIILPQEAENAVFNENGKFVSFTQADNLFIAFSNGKVTQITDDGGNGIVNGKAVHRSEFGISGGIFNSPKGNYIAFYRKDESMVKDYPLVNHMGCQSEVELVKYPMAGMKSHHVTLGVFNVETKKIMFLNTGESLEHYLTNITWSPDEKYIYMAELNREQNHMQLNCYSIASGEKASTLFEERSDKYVEPLHPIQFSKVNPNEFYYLSRKDGWFHVYKYNTSGELIQQITNGEWEVTAILGFDTKEKNMFIQATLDSPLERHLYKVNLKSGKIDKLSSAEGFHNGILSPKGKFILDTWQGEDVPRKSDLISVKKKWQHNVFTAEDPLKDYQLGNNKLITLKTKDGKSNLYGRLITPIDFDPTKKYPVIIYVYGGPHSQMISKKWHNSARWWQYYMADKGYVSFTLDNRGTNNRGRDFETAIHRQLGTLETEDQMQGVKYLKSLPYIDSNRIGVHGWSYGGFMTLNLKLKHSDVFKVGVAGGPVVDWQMYEIMYGERYMDSPERNPEGYKKNNMTNYVSNLTGKLLLIHGAKDKTVVMQHSMKFLRECVKQNKQVDFFTYPTHEHNVRGKDRIHLMDKVSQYFIDNL